MQSAQIQRIIVTSALVLVAAFSELYAGEADTLESRDKALVALVRSMREIKNSDLNSVIKLKKLRELTDAFSKRNDELGFVATVKNIHIVNNKMDVWVQAINGRKARGSIDLIVPDNLSDTFLEQARVGSLVRLTGQVSDGTMIEQRLTTQIDGEDAHLIFYINGISLWHENAKSSKAAQVTEVRNWKSADDKFRAEAKLIGKDGDAVTLEKPNGSRIIVEFTDLCAADQLYIQERN